MNLPIELKTRIYDHIGTVQKHLAELPADEQRDILQTLETHIHDALEARSNGNPDLDILEAIIAEMDPPESYGSAPLIAPPDSTSFSSGRKIFFFCSIATLCILFIAIWLADPFSSHWMDEAPTEQETSPDAAQVVPMSAEKTGPTASRPSPLIGKWVAVDFVSSISEFEPKRQYHTGDLELKGLEFLKDGTTDKPWWSWQDNQLIHSGNRSTGEVVIVRINTEDYLFMQWMSGDVLVRDQKPNYYVLQRGGYLDPDAPKTIIEGVGWEAFHLGATREELIAEFGLPDSRNSSVMTWQDKHLSCTVVNGERGAVQLSFGFGSNATTSKGVGFGASEEKTIEVYGTPSRMSTPRSHATRQGHTATRKTMTWPEHGIQITFKDSKADQIDIIKPQIP